MIRKIILGSVAFIAFYVGIVQVQVLLVRRDLSRQQAQSVQDSAKHKVYTFSFAKFSPKGEKEIEIEGDSADILAETVYLTNVVAKAYAEEVPVTITADKGDYQKSANEVHLTENVVATAENGARLLTEKLNIHPDTKTLETDVEAEVRKDNINIKGMGASGDSRLKKVKFKKNVTVVIQNPDQPSKDPTLITCDGPLVIDYDKNVAHFKDNVVAEDTRGKLLADVMDVYYNKQSRRVGKIVATGNVTIENPDGNKTFSESVVYLADEGRVILGGDAEALYKEGTGAAVKNQVF